jgi:hypothetical protein
MSSRVRLIAGAAAIAVALLSFVSFAVAPPLRDEVNLAGAWTQGGAVPCTRGSSFTTKTFERSFTVPAGWTGKRIFLELEGVNFSPITSIDGAEIGRITGSWLPHSYDITSIATPGSTHTLTIVANGTCPTNWPAGYPGDSRWAGVIHDVCLRAYGMVAIRDAEIITSTANKTITVNYDVQNFNTSAKTITVNGTVVPSTGGAAALTLATAGTAFTAGERKIVQVSSPWTNPNLWWPTDPKLYLLCSAVKESGATVDSQTIRFGFRDSKRSGKFVTLNGVRMNARGESVWPTPADAAAMRDWIAMEKSVNANSIRFHVNPPPGFMLDECDELGQMIEPEAPLWQAPASTVNFSDNRTIWYPAWVKHIRNHASIVWWSVANETVQQNLWPLVQAMRDNDGSGRPIWNEAGDHAGYIQDSLHITDHSHLWSDHYTTQTLTKNPTAGNVYIINDPAGIPGGMGEQLACCGSWACPEPDIYYWQGIFVRGERYQDAAGFGAIMQIHVYNYSPWVNNANNAVAKTVLKNSYAAVALYDHEYVNLGIAPFKDNVYPSIAAGSTASRALDLYNDEFSDSTAKVQVDIKSGTTTYATGTRQYNVTLGFHIRVPISFQVPYVGGSIIDMVLTTIKGGVQKFTEALRFNVTGASSGTSSSTVTFTGGTGTNAPNAIANSSHELVALIFGKTTVVLPISGVGNAEKASVSIFTMRGNCLCRAPAFADNSGGMVAAFGSQLPAGNYIVKVSIDGRENSGHFCLEK